MKALATDTTSALDREYARLFGDKAPSSEVKRLPSAESSLSESSCSSSTENLPPPKGSPPPLPFPSSGNTAVSPQTALGQLELSSQELQSAEEAELQTAVNSAASTPDDNNNIEEGGVAGAPVLAMPPASNSHFASGRITSPKMVRRNKAASAGGSKGLQSSGVQQSPTLLYEGATPTPHPLGKLNTVHSFFRLCVLFVQKFTFIDLNTIGYHHYHY